jgi:hypothetical protein
MLSLSIVGSHSQKSESDDTMTLLGISPLLLRHVQPKLLRGTVRSLAVSRIKSPGSDPLEVWKKECIARNICDEDGGRLPGSHWTVCIAIATETSSKVRGDCLCFVCHSSSSDCLFLTQMSFFSDRTPAPEPPHHWGGAH